MCNKAVDNYPHASEFVSEWYKTQNICVKAVDPYPSTTKFVPEYLMTEEIFDKAVNRCFSYLLLFLIYIKLKKFVTELFLNIFL